MTHGERQLRRAVRRRRPIAFWHLGRDKLVLAVLARDDDEPLLVACGGVCARRLGWDDAFAPGILDLSATCESLTRLHVATLDAVYLERRSAVETPQQMANGPVPGSGSPEATLGHFVEVDTEGSKALVPRSLVDRAIGLFSAAGLRLVLLTCEAEARSGLARFLGNPRAGAAGAGSLAADPLAAVSVAPQCAAAAKALGDLLTVPVGMALSVFGMLEES